MSTRFKRALLGVATATALVVSGGALGTGAVSAADGTLTLDPSSGTGTTPFSVQTSAGCANANATHFIVKMTGSGLKEEVNLTGVTLLSAASSTPTSTDPIRTPVSKTFEVVKGENGNVLPNGGYTISFQCRAQMSTTPLRTFTTMITITNSGSTISWQEGFTPVKEPVVNVTKPAVKGTKKVGKTLRATSGAWTPASAKVTYKWKLGKKTISKKAKVTVPKSAKGKTIKLVVTATASGYSPGKATVNVKIK